MRDYYSVRLFNQLFRKFAEEFNVGYHYPWFSKFGKFEMQFYAYDYLRVKVVYNNESNSSDDEPWLRAYINGACWTWSKFDLYPAPRLEDVDQWVKELDDNIRLRIPDKYLESLKDD